MKLKDRNQSNHGGSHLFEKEVGVFGETLLGDTEKEKSFVETTN